MKLPELIEKLNTIDEELIILQENKDDPNSDIILSTGDVVDNGVKDERGRKYYYLIEVFLAKEFVQDWINSLNYLPSHSETAKRLYQYAINDA
jgi:hypothetical protein